MKTKFIAEIIIGVIVFGAIAYFFYEPNINSFEECIAAGNPMMESYPRQCYTQDGKHFVEEIR